MSLTGRQMGRYRILEQLGSGGMSVVYKGLDTALDREVAIKVLHPHLAQKADSRQRLAREAKAVAKLHHPNIVEVFDFALGEEEDAFLVTELIPGQTLRAFLDVERFEPPELAAMVVHQIAEALAHAHEAGVIHRDLKPENVMVRQDGVLKLMDFGIAKILDRDDRMTQTGALVGSPAHMAPEVIEGEAVGPEADVFSLGTMLYLFATGALPFAGPSTTATLKRILDAEFADPRQRSQAVSDELAELIRRCLARDPAARFSSAVTLRDALAAYLATLGVDRPDEELVAFFGDPAGYREALVARVVARRLAQAEEAVREGRSARAVACLNPLLALEPSNPRARELLARMGRKRRRRRAMRRAAVGMASAAVLAGLGVGVYAWQGRPNRGSAPVTNGSANVGSAPATPRSTNGGSAVPSTGSANGSPSPAAGGANGSAAATPRSANGGSAVPSTGSANGGPPPAAGDANGGAVVTSAGRKNGRSAPSTTGNASGGPAPSKTGNANGSTTPAAGDVNGRSALPTSRSNNNRSGALTTRDANERLNPSASVATNERLNPSASVATNERLNPSTSAGANDRSEPSKSGDANDRSEPSRSDGVNAHPGRSTTGGLALASGASVGPAGRTTPTHSATQARAEPTPLAAQILVRPYGYIQVDGEPRSAEALAQHELQLLPGKHRVEITCQFCDPTRSTITVRPGRPNVFRLPAELKASHLSFDYTPSDAVVTVQGIPARTVAQTLGDPLTVTSPKGPPSFQHQVTYEIRREGYATEHKTVLIPAGQTVVLHGKLNPK